MAMNNVFLDTSYALALTIDSDTHHSKARELAASLEEQKIKLITTAGVVVEIGHALGRSRFRNRAIVLLNSFARDSSTEIVPVSRDLLNRAIDLYRQRPDKEWGLTDCVSFVVMQERGMTDALTADEHFQQAGFRALLRES